MTATFHVDDPTAPAPNVPRALGAPIVLLDHTGDRVLLEHRADSDVWGLFGGGVDDDESVTTALHREVREETGLTLAEHHLLGIFSNPTRIAAYPDGNVRQVVAVTFIGRLAPGELRLSEESRAAHWFGWEDIPWAKIAATQHLALRRARIWVEGDRTPYVE
ncbi:NUDIX domain-containing protein [Luteipulveratus flavus]|uniref:NUDIX domain-containing protein n=1 Tax=Luteipulveratus flavus TaxID=3031728 RepID=A0ABT6C5E1_9MICO|nr:NUDIX domain-containing protein [Luteipulveratus sp. YIM 133296]MDF8263274.1 NUDIX domain-containing protein [Luteipulveratus sp. YIM 133296]